MKKAITLASASLLLVACGEPVPPTAEEIQQAQNKDYEAFVNAEEYLTAMSIENISVENCDLKLATKNLFHCKYEGEKTTNISGKISKKISKPTRYIYLNDDDVWVLILNSQAEDLINAEKSAGE